MILCRLLLFLTLSSFTAPVFAGTVQVDQKGPETFTVTFEKTTRTGGIEGAMKGAKRYAAALCHAAGYTSYQILDREARKGKFSLLPTTGHVAGVEILFLDSPSQEGQTHKCEGTKKDLRKMKKWLRTLDYERPEPRSSPDSTSPEDGRSD